MKTCDADDYCDLNFDPLPEPAAPAFEPPGPDDDCCDLRPAAASKDLRASHVFAVYTLSTGWHAKVIVRVGRKDERVVHATRAVRERAQAVREAYDWLAEAMGEAE